MLLHRRMRSGRADRETKNPRQGGGFAEPVLKGSSAAAGGCQAEQRQAGQGQRARLGEARILETGGHRHPVAKRASSSAAIGLQREVALASPGCRIVGLVHEAALAVGGVEAEGQAAGSRHARIFAGNPIFPTKGGYADLGIKAENRVPEVVALVFTNARLPPPARKAVSTADAPAAIPPPASEQQPPVAST